MDMLRDQPVSKDFHALLPQANRSRGNHLHYLGKLELDLDNGQTIMPSGFFFCISCFCMCWCYPVLHVIFFTQRMAFWSPEYTSKSSAGPPTHTLPPGRKFFSVSHFWLWESLKWLGWPSSHCKPELLSKTITVVMEIGIFIGCI